MSAYEVISLNTRQIKLVERFHTPEAAAKEVKIRQLAMHTGVKILVVKVEPLPDDAMTKRGGLGTKGVRA
jgi:hypothetical protein